MRLGPIALGAIILLLLFGAHFISSQFIDFEWWSEVHQVETWINLWIYGTFPAAFAALLLFGAFVIAWRLGVRKSHDRNSSASQSALVYLVLIALAAFVVHVLIDSWTAVRYFGGLRLGAEPATFIDPIFGKPLRFYFFDLPFYNLLLRLFLTGSILSLLIFWVSAHFQDLRYRFLRLQNGGAIDIDDMALGGAFDSSFARWILAILLLGFAFEFYFSRYDLLFEDHGAYLLGVDYVSDHVTLPLQWLLCAGAVLAAALVLLRRFRLVLLLLLLLPLRFFLPSIVRSIYVRPNELALEKPYIGHHIEATRAAFGLTTRVTESTLNAKSEIAINYSKHKPLLDNVRLWDWQAFHDTVSQIQPLRPYRYIDSDVDRYQIDGQLRQLMITPRELDISQLGEARSRWINPHLVYTHGYGIVMAEANRITSEGLPVLFVQDAPPKVNSPSLKFTTPQLYYGEAAQEPVYVGTGQEEFDYPSGEKNVHTHYHGKGGIPINFLSRLAAAVEYGDPNVLLTNYFTDNSRLMIHRQVRERLSTLAGFVQWDEDPYIVLTNEGRLVWMVDGYMTSSAHPYARELDIDGIGTVNYMRNSVKATIDAYSGETHLYVFNQADPLIQAYWKLFPTLFEPESSMPKDLRQHARYPETLFAVQAEIYRAFHMRDPEAFYNRADLWDIAKTSNRGAQGVSPVKPTYVVATLPGEDTPEFLLITPFTPANKDNLIGMMIARCDGDHLGEKVFQQLDKDNIIFGPKQIEAFINQDQTISKDLSLWNQQGSQALRGQILVLPIENSFLYVQPIYIQSAEGRMPQLKKVVVAMGNRLAYSDTYEQSLNILTGEEGAIAAVAGHAAAPATTASATGPATSPSTPASPISPQLLQQLREHLKRYQEFNGQGKYAEAGKELETIETLLK